MTSYVKRTLPFRPPAPPEQQPNLPNTHIHTLPAPVCSRHAAAGRHRQQTLAPRPRPHTPLTPTPTSPGTTRHAAPPHLVVVHARLAPKVVLPMVDHVPCMVCVCVWRGGGGGATKTARARWPWRLPDCMRAATAQPKPRCPLPPSPPYPPIHAPLSGRRHMKPLHASMPSYAPVHMAGRFAHA